ncbi:MAG: DNA repair protein RecN [Rhodospirillaceae bacterium]|nr:DNA repair protein RecN [Rhodospirillaceae bacterium]
MLVHLSVHDVVLIEQLELEFDNGLCALTGETGAGKSILLDALGLVLGRRADVSLVRKGAQRAAVAATFRFSLGHPALVFVEQMGIESEGEIVIRRTINLEGRSRAFVNDQPVTVAYLADLGSLLVEVHGQNDRLGLLDQRVHRAVLDIAGNHGDLCAEVKLAYKNWAHAKQKLDAARELAEEGRLQEEALRRDLSELEGLSPKPGEEEELTKLRSLLKESTSISESLAAAHAQLGDGEGGSIEVRVAMARRAIDAKADVSGGYLNELLQSLDRLSIELTETLTVMESVGGKLDADPQRLSEVEERLFLLKELAVKHAVSIDGLEEVQIRLETELKKMGSVDQQVKEEEANVKAGEIRLSNLISKLHLARMKTGQKLDLGVMQEVHDLKMEGVKFNTSIQELPKEQWSENGGDKISFEVSTAPGLAPGPIYKVASGGELSRFMLALRVVIADSAPIKTLVFDEIDTGIGGAVADSVGQRLSRLAGNVQVLVVTHQPQIAVQARRHFKVFKDLHGGEAITGVEQLTAAGCIEEIARMLAGEMITEEARAAAKRLMHEAR